jgi:ABC-type antimicrobial peptide transport system permease subunit
VTVVLGLAVRRLHAAPGRTALAALGVLAAAAMAGTAITVAVSLSGGFGRAAEQADLPDVLARFGQRSQREVEGRVGALPNLASRSYRLEINDVPLAAGEQSTRKGAVEIPLGGRRGYAIAEGRDLSGRPGEVVIERGLADEWGVGVGDAVSVGRLGPQRVVGVSLEPSNVAFPLAGAAHVYLPAGPIARRFGPLPANVALLWVNDRRRLDETLVQARAVSYGLTNLRLVTRDGVRVIVGQAAGIVIALLGAFSLVTLAAAGLMLGAAASADVQRRMPAIAVQRAVGLSRGRVTAAHAVEGAIVALPSAAVGLALGALVTIGPADRLLRTLNEVGAGAALLGWLVLGGAGLVAITAAASAWPAWRAAGRPPATVLRGGDLGRPRARGGRSAAWARRGAAGEAAAAASLGGGFLALGVRLGAARRGRLAATVVVLAASAATALLLLSLASLLQRLSEDPALLGRRYQLTVALPPSAAPDVRRIRGVAEVAPRRVVDASDAFSLGEPLRLIAYPGDHTVFEAPPLAEGRRRRGPREAEVGRGLADVLGLRPGSTLAAALPSGREVRYRVVGIVRALDNDGRIAYVGASGLVAAGAGGNPNLAVRLAPRADRATVSRELRELTGVQPRRVGGASTSNQSFLGVLADVLLAVAGVTAVLCL